MKRHNDRPIKDALKNMVDAYRLKPKLNQKKIEVIWAEAMGVGISRYTKEVKLRKDKLFLTIDSAPLRQELSYGKEKIIKILNEELGEEVIKNVVIR